MRKILSRLDLNDNITIVLIEAVFLGILFASDAFLPVFLTRLGASAFQVSLISSMPAVAGLVFSIPMGNFLQNRRRMVSWYSMPRMATAAAYTLTGVVPFLFIAQGTAVIAILGVWAVATIPQVILMITFSVVMNAVAGPERRYDMMAKRWAIVGLTSAVSMAGMGWMLEQIVFPLNYQILFISLAVLGGVFAYYFGNRINLPENTRPRPSQRTPLLQTLKEYTVLLKKNPSFSKFMRNRFVFMLGMMTANPLFAVYYVRQAHATDSWIGIISTVQMSVMVVGYFFWMRQARKKISNRSILLWTTLGLGLYPALIATTQSVQVIALITGAAYFFQAGLDLVFFDELMSFVPIEESIQYVSLAQSIQYIATIAGPLLGSFLAGQIGLVGALLVGAVIRGLGFLLFFFRKQSIID